MDKPLFRPGFEDVTFRVQESPPVVYRFTCPRCGWTSHHPEDLAHRYCGHCHQFFPETP